MCEMSDVFAAAAPVSGQFPIPQEADCEQSRPVPLLHIHGSNDPLVPKEGIEGFTRSVTDSTGFFAQKYGCGETIVTTDLPDIAPDDGSTVSHSVYTGCPQGVAVEYYIAHDAAHTWPDARPSERLGVTNRDIKRQ